MTGLLYLIVIFVNNALCVLGFPFTCHLSQLNLKDKWAHGLWQTDQSVCGGFSSFLQVHQLSCFPPATSAPSSGGINEYHCQKRAFFPSFGSLSTASSDVSLNEHLLLSVLALFVLLFLFFTQWYNKLFTQFITSHRFGTSTTALSENATQLMTRTKQPSAAGQVGQLVLHLQATLD